MKTDYTKRLNVKKSLDELTEKTEELTEHLGDFENFHKVTMERVFGMLANAEEFKIHPLVLEHLKAIEKLGNS